MIDTYTENSTDIQGLDKIAIIVSPQNGNDYNILHVSLPVINFVLVSTPITYKKYKVYHNHAPESIYNVVPGLYNLNYTYEIKEETDEGTPGSPTYKALYKDYSKWNLGVVDSNVNIEGRLNNTVSLNTVSIIHIQSNIQDDSYIVFKADVNLYLIDPSDRYNPVYNNTKPNNCDMSSNKKIIMAPRTIGAIIIKTVSCNKSPLPLPFLLCSYHN